VRENCTHGLMREGRVTPALYSTYCLLQANYRQTFTALGTNLAGLANELNPINLVYANDGRAQCSMIRNEVTQAGTVPVEYVVYFSNEDGIWKLRDF
jgi:hypothetical protein